MGQKATTPATLQDGNEATTRSAVLPSQVKGPLARFKAACDEILMLRRQRFDCVQRRIVFLNTPDQFKKHDVADPSKDDRGAAIECDAKVTAFLKELANLIPECARMARSAGMSDADVVEKLRSIRSRLSVWGSIECQEKRDEYDHYYQECYWAGPDIEVLASEFWDEFLDPLLIRLADVEAGHGPPPPHGLVGVVVAQNAPRTTLTESPAWLHESSSEPPQEFYRGQSLTGTQTEMGFAIRHDNLTPVETDRALRDYLKRAALSKAPRIWCRKTLTDDIEVYLRLREPSDVEAVLKELHACEARLLSFKTQKSAEGNGREGKSTEATSPNS